ncbi:MAG TPA: polysaccharide biosynthesis tyrosine autokinase [Terracidiphilus sp.]
MDAPLKFGGQIGARLGPEGLKETVALSEVIEQLAGFIRRQFPIFVFFIACSLALGSVYLFTTPASFTSHTMLLIDSSKVRILQQEAQLSDIPIDAAQVETQVEILKSEGIGLSVIKELKLTDVPEFTGRGSGLIGRVTGMFASKEVPSDTALVRKALATFLSKRTIVRVGHTYVLDLGYTSLDPVRSASVANAIADAYVVDQLESKYQATRRASRWLQDRIKELRQQVSDADRAVQDYKEKNNIVSVGGGADGTNSRLLGEQQVEELSSQLSSARANAGETKARLERIEQVLKRDAPDATMDATVTDSLHSEVINRLRTNYLDLAAKEAIWTARYGADHLATVNLRTQMTELRRSIIDELGRIAQGYKSDYEIAKSRVEGLEQSLKSLITNSQVTNRDRLGLRDLESTAKVYHTLYDNFLQRYMEAIQQQSFPITEARVISSAAAPEHKSGPLTFVVLGIAAFMGIVLAFAAAVLREAIDQVLRTSRQVENALNVNCLAVLPRLGGASSESTWSGNARLALRRKPSSGTPSKDFEVADAPTFDIALLSREILAPTKIAEPRASTDKKLTYSSGSLLRQVVDESLSGFAEAFRSIKIAADIGGSNGNHQVIGITSTIPSEGKSTVACNLAQLIAHSGKRVILLDGDLRNPSLTRVLTPTAKVGLPEVLNNKLALRDAVYHDEQTGLEFLPAKLKLRIAHTNEILASNEFKVIVNQLREAYDYVIIDFPPLAPVVDVRATTKVVDSYLYVVEWGKTRKSLVQQQLLGAPEIYELLLGVVLNKADVRVMGRYEDYYGAYDPKQYYGRYGYSG